MKYHPSPPLRLLRRFFRSVEKNGVREALLRSHQRLYRSLKNHGFSGTFERAFIKAPTAPQFCYPQQTHPFDVLHGTDTGGSVSAADLDAVSLSALHATGYMGIPPSTLRSALAALPLDHKDFSFVDIGCGKGRALFVAAEFPFRRLFGVEIVPELCEAAWANVALNPEWEKRVSIANQDATSFIFPDGPLVLFFYYPFYAAIFRRVLANLERQLRESPRPIYLLYCDYYANALDANAVYAHTPTYQKVIHSLPSIREVSDMVYPLSAEDAAAEPSGAKLSRFLLYYAGTGSEGESVTESHKHHVLEV